MHVYTWYNATSKVGTKAAAMKANYHLLASFGKNRRLNFVALEQVKWTCS